MLKSPELQDAAVLVLANKIDLPHAVPASDVLRALEMPSTCQSRPWNVQGTCAVTGDGIYEGFGWLQTTLAEMRRKKGTHKFGDTDSA